MTFAACSAVGSAQSGAAPPLLVDPLAESALSAALRTTDTSQKAREISAASLDIETRAAQFPADLAKARIVLARGFSPAELQKATTAGALEVTQVEAKIPVPGSVEVYTVILAGTALEKVEGGVALRTQSALQSVQEKFAKLALADAASRAKYTALSRNPLLIYSFDAIGTNGALAALGKSPNVRIVHRLHSEDAAQEKDSLQSLRESMRELRSSAIEKSTGAVTGRFAPGGVSTNEACDPDTGICPDEPDDGEYIEPPPIPFPTMTGIPFVDSAFNSSTQFGDPYKDEKIQLSMPASFWLDCDASVPNNKCPNDYTFTTRRETGGSLAWAASVRRIGGPVSTTECELLYDWPTTERNARFSWYCYRVRINRPKWTYTTAASQFTFGGRQVDVPLSPGVTNVVSTHHISTFAWNGTPKRADGWPERCVPTGSIWEVERPCQYYDLNGSWVEGLSGFEDKITFPNPECDLLNRTGTSTDKGFQCFSSDQVVTNLPNAYLDTTFLDGGANYIASVGVPDGKQLLVNFPYETTIEGSMRGWESVRGLSARHSQAVTARDNAGIPCTTGVGGGAAGSSAACMFNVDLVRVGADQVFR